MPLDLDARSSFRSALPELGVDWSPSPVAAPELLVLNEALAGELGLDPARLASPEGVEVLAGNATPPGATPIAMAYAGHQFGGFSPVLGDGRALLVGEVVDRRGARRDVHLKGSGRTPFARGGDGRASVGPMLREYLVAEAMHALGVPTARALAVVATGEQVVRDRGPEPGAVLTRVASSHLRIGTFEFAARLGDPAVLARLVDYAVERHHPRAAEAPNRALALLEAVAEAQAALVARWMAVGFVHGVMNTDNMTISGETIDYGPCAFMDRYDPATVYSSIDHGGRYASGNQPAVAGWNLARLAETLLPLVDDDPDAAVAAATAVLEGFADRFRGHHDRAMADKLGLEHPGATARALAGDLLELFRADGVDHTAGFRALGDWQRGDQRPLRAMCSGQGELDAWAGRWQASLRAEGRDPEVVAAGVDRANPVVIPRNHLVEEALAAAVAGDLQPFGDLLDAVREPYASRPGRERFALGAPEGFERTFRTYCGT